MEGAVACNARAEQAGWIHYLGVTASRSDERDDLAKLMLTEELDFVQLNYSLDNRGVEQKLLPVAVKSGIAVMVNIPFGHGRLFKAVTNQSLSDWAK